MIYNLFQYNMVRLDKCVEALYDSVTADNRTKNLQILTVMKGAISMSRSKTGECIFRTNKNEKKNLERLLKIEGRNANYTISQIGSHQKHVMSRWSKVLENQASCSSQALFEELLEIEDVDDSPKGDSNVNRDSPELTDYKLKTLVDLRLEKLESENNKSGFATVMASRRRHTNNYDNQMVERIVDSNKEQPESEFVTERKQIRTKYAEGISGTQDFVTAEDQVVKAHGTVLAKTKSLHLPVIRRDGPSAPSKTSPEESKTPTLERDLTDWGNWSLKDKSWIKGYLYREKTRHEDLIIRNALNRIETEMSGANVIKRQQLRQKLQAERQQREAETRRIERIKKEAEMQMSREATMVSSENVTNAVESLDTECKAVKKVAFQEPLLMRQKMEKQNRVSLVQTNKAKRRYKPTQAYASPLPAIKESSASCIMKVSLN